MGSNPIDSAKFGKFVTEEQIIAELRRASGQLRHAYSQLIARPLKDPQSFADGLLSPQISRLESLADRLERGE